MTPILMMPQQGEALTRGQYMVLRDRLDGVDPTWGIHHHDAPPAWRRYTLSDSTYSNRD